MQNNNRPTALITGASSGIGSALALLLAHKGYHLILIARRAERLEDLKNKIQSTAPDCRVEIHAVDVTQYAAQMQAIQKLVANFESLDLVIANAGVGFTTSEWDNTWESSLKTIEVNLLGAIATIEAAKDFMLNQGNGHIVAISSSAATRGLPQSSAYCASKAGLTHFLESMRIDLRDKNITVTAVQPGFVLTPMTEKNGAMPWVMTADKAAQIIYKAICKKKARLDFPWQMAIVIRLMRLMPDFLYDFGMKLAREWARKFKQNRA